MGFSEAFGCRCAAHVFRECRAHLLREPRPPRLRSRPAGRHHADRTTLSIPCNGRCPPASRGWRANRTVNSSPEGGFYTQDRKARFVRADPPAPSAPAGKGFPFRLNTGRVRDQWHTMTRSGLSPRLGAHAPEPFVEVHPADAKAKNLVDGAFAQVTTPLGFVRTQGRFSARHNGAARFLLPIHWSDATASAARIGNLVMPETDRHSGQPDAKATPAAIAPVTFAFRGFALTRRPLALPDGTWWARVALGAGQRACCSPATTAPRPGASARTPCSATTPSSPNSATTGAAPTARRRSSPGRLEGCLFIGPAATAPQWDAVKALFETGMLNEAARRVLLSGRSADGLASAGPIVCACFGVGLTAIRDAIANRARRSDVEGIGAALRAGTNCGSCLPELKRIVADVAGTAPAGTGSARMIAS